MNSHQILVEALAGSDEGAVMQEIQNHTNNSWSEWFRFISPKKEAEKIRA